MKGGRPTIAKLGVFTGLTVGFYTAFFLFIGPLVELFTSGTLLGAIAVVATAMLFSFVHGAFANYLLEALGLRMLGKQGE